MGKLFAIVCLDGVRSISKPNDCTLYEIAGRVTSGLSVCINKTLSARVISISEDFFDNAILSFISEEPKSQISVISDFLGKWYCTDFRFVSERIEYLIKIGKIEIVENKTDNKGSYIIRTIKKK